MVETNSTGQETWPKYLGAFWRVELLWKYIRDHGRDAEGLEMILEICDSQGRTQIYMYPRKRNYDDVQSILLSDPSEPFPHHGSGRNP